MFQVPFCAGFSLASWGVVTRLIHNREVKFREPTVPRIHLEDEPGQMNHKSPTRRMYIGVEGFQGRRAIFISLVVLAGHMFPDHAREHSPATPIPPSPSASMNKMLFNIKTAEGSVNM